MGFVYLQRKWLISGILILILIMIGINRWGDQPAALAQEGDIGAAAVFTDATYSSPIVVSNGGGRVWAVNPDDDSVSVIDANNNTELRRIRVGDEPQSIAIDPDSKFVYVANTADSSVTIIRVAPGGAFGPVIEETFFTGAEPWNLVISPDGKRVYVANSGQDTITVIQADVDPPIILGNKRLDNTNCNGSDALEKQRHFQPRGLAVTANSNRMFITRFLSFVDSSGDQGDDTGKVGIVCRVQIDTTSTDINTAITNFLPITLNPQDTGFVATINNVSTPTQAYPNQLQSIVISGSVAYLPNIAASPDAPLRFNVDTHAFVNMIGGVSSGTLTDLGALNLHLGARVPEAGKPRLFFANPWAIALAKDRTAYVVSAGSDLVVKLRITPSGLLTFTGGVSTTRYIDLNPNDPAENITYGRNAGKNPLGIAIRDTGVPEQRRAYVMNYISRNISVVDIGVGSANRDKVIAVINLTDLPPPNTLEEQLQVGAEIFFSSRGHFQRPAGTTVSTDNRLSSEGWQNCASCHFAGLTDGNVWIFGAGPRKSVPLNGTWSPHNPDDQRILNYSAIFEEVEDFEANIRNVSGPAFLDPPTNTIMNPDFGLIFGNSINQAPAAVPSLLPIANAGRPQHTVKLPGAGRPEYPALEAMRQWVRFAIRTPNGALTDNELTTTDPTKVVGGLPTLGNPSDAGGVDDTEVAQGRILFFRAGCHKCHGGTKWTISNKDFESPPAAGEVADELPAANAVNTTFLSRFLFDIDSFNLGVSGQGNPIGGDIGAIEKANKANSSSENGFEALGKDHDNDNKGKGYNIPSLLGIWALQPYYHNGACESLDCVLTDVTHRRAGFSSSLLDPHSERDKVVAFLKTLDAETDFPINLSIDPHDISLNPPTVFKGRPVEVGANVSLFGTKADLEGLISGQMTVVFTLTTTAGTLSNSVPLFPDDFNQDFGQSVNSSGQPLVTTTFNVPSNAGILGTVRVRVDSDNQLLEFREQDNLASRTVLIFPQPPDHTPPVVTNVYISDNDPFSNSDPIVRTTNVRVKIVASDPDNPPQPTSGLKSFCIVRYIYSVVLRRWVHQPCFFQLLPAPTAPNTFIVNTTLEPVEGVAYAFVWVSDDEGNISRAPGFDVVSFIPDTPITLNRNDVRLFRIVTSEAQEITFDPDFGDIDISVFQGFTPSATRCDLSANNGSATEVVEIASGSCNTGTQYQVEVRALANSRFTISLDPDFASSGGGGVQAAANLDQPVIAGPPALLTAIDVASGFDTFLPTIFK